MERRGLLARIRDRRDRRRSLVWLTGQGQAVLEKETRVLAPERLTQALAGLSSAQRRALVNGLSLLADAAERSFQDIGRTRKLQRKDRVHAAPLRQLRNADR
jgi:DNA-binding MarR family transcriptional regulator